MDRKSSNPAKHGITVSFQNSSGAELAKLSFGKTLDAASSSPFGGGGSTGRYIRNHDDKSGFYVVSELFSSLSADPKDWLANEFFEIEKIKTVSLTKPGSDEAEWTLTRDDEDAEFRFSDAFPGVKADPAAVTPLKSLFSYARFDDLVPSAKAKKIWDTEKLQKATVSTFEGLTYRLSLQPAKAPKGKATSENYLFSVDVSGELPEERKKPEGEDEKTAEAADKAFDERRSSLSKSLEQARKLEGITFEVSKSSISALLKNRTELMNKGPGPHSATPSQSGNTAFSPPISIPMHPDSEESDE